MGVGMGFADLFGTQSYVYELSERGRFRSTGLVEAVFRELYDKEVREGGDDVIATWH